MKVGDSLFRNLKKIAGGLNVAGGAGGAGGSGSAAGAIQGDLGCYQVCFEGGMLQKYQSLEFGVKFEVKNAFHMGVMDRTFMMGISFAGDPASVRTEERWVYTGEGRGSYSQDWAAKQAGQKGKFHFIKQHLAIGICLTMLFPLVLPQGLTIASHFGRNVVSWSASHILSQSATFAQQCDGNS